MPPRVVCVCVYVDVVHSSFINYVFLFRCSGCCVCVPRSSPHTFWTFDRVAQCVCMVIITSALFSDACRVCHIATELVKGLNEKHKAEPVKGPNEKPLKDQPLIPPKDELCVQIAALCHDLGEKNKISWACMYCNASVTVAESRLYACMIFIKDMDHFHICYMRNFCKRMTVILQLVRLWKHGERYSYTYSINSHMILVLRLMNYFHRMHAWQHEYRSAKILEELLNDSQFWDLKLNPITREDLHFIQGMITFSEDLSTEIEKQPKDWEDDVRREKALEAFMPVIYTQKIVHDSLISCLCI